MTKYTDILKEFRNEFVVDGEMTMRENSKEDIERHEQFLVKKLRDAEQRGHDLGTKEFDEWKEIEEADEAHRVAEGYCCACGYDMAVLDSKLKARDKQWIEALGKEEPMRDYKDIHGVKHPIESQIVKNKLRKKVLKKMKL